ncbi:heme ABC exporter ATP-binding protein CcmA [Candidatus Endowatersipora endosymbiont of Watersipora subatra]|uniref:heme ABC exporter ATP-binding protein CcmA n=1 Tax=Candidatus Endowatersipora endosymbiont of Watersipora subatra TaxID=3077946 RepID=UPI00312C912A
MELVADKIKVIRGGKIVFSNLSFRVPVGYALVIHGMNGSGKSTLIRSVAQLLPIESGLIKLRARPKRLHQHSISELCHYLGHENGMKMTFSVEENLMFWRDFLGNHYLNIEKALEVVGLSGLSSLPYSLLSTGQRRWVAIARLLVSYRQIWLLDEPTSGLDEASQEQFCQLMNTHLDDGGMILVASHLPLTVNRFVTLTLTD